MGCVGMHTNDNPRAGSASACLSKCVCLSPLLVYPARLIRRHLHVFVCACVRCRRQGARGYPQGGLAAKVKILLNIIIGQHSTRYRANKNKSRAKETCREPHTHTFRRTRRQSASVLQPWHCARPRRSPLMTEAVPGASLIPCTRSLRLQDGASTRRELESSCGKTGSIYYDPGRRRGEGMCEVRLRVSFSCDSLMQVLCDTILMQIRGKISLAFYFHKYI